MADEILVKWRAATEQYNKAVQGIIEQNEQVGTSAETSEKEVDTSFKKMEKSSDKLGTSIKKLGGALIGAFAIKAIVSDAVRTIKEFDEAIADVRKTTGLTSKAARELAKELFRIDTRSSVQELLKLATAAGRLGIAEKDIADFVRQADKAFVALGDDLGGSAEEIATNLGRIAGVFGIEEAEGIGEALNKVGSTLNELGANTKANAGFIVDFTERLAGVAPQAGISFQAIAGLGATLQEFGQSAEIGASTLNKLLPLIGKDVPKFARIAGKSIEEFSTLLREDANEALLQVLEGAKKGGGVQGLSKALAELGVDGARSAGIIGVLSENIDTVRKNQELASVAFAEGTSLAEEFGVKNETLGANVDKLSNSWDKLVLSIEDGSGPISSFFTSVTKEATTFLDALVDINDAKNFEFIDELSDAGKATVNIAKLNPIFQKFFGDQLESIDNLNNLRKEAAKEQEEIEEEATDTTNDNVQAKRSLFDIQKDLLKQAKEFPEATEAEIKSKNQRIDQINKEIKRLKELGVETKKQQAEREKAEKDRIKNAISGREFDEIVRDEEAKEFEESLKQDDIVFERNQAMAQAEIDADNAVFENFNKNLELTNALKEEEFELDQERAKQKEEDDKKRNAQRVDDAIFIAQALVDVAFLFAEDTKENAVAQAKIQAFLGAAATFAQTSGGPFIRGIAAAQALAFGLARAREIENQPLRLAEGTELITGGQQGKDSVPAYLMPGEAVINAKNNDPLKSKAYNTGTLDDYYMAMQTMPALNALDNAHKKANDMSFAENVANSFALQLGDQNITNWQKKQFRGDKRNTEAIIKALQGQHTTRR